MVACSPFVGPFALLDVASCADVTRVQLCARFACSTHRSASGSVSPDGLTLVLLSGGRAVGRARVTMLQHNV